MHQLRKGTMRINGTLRLVLAMVAMASLAAVLGCVGAAQPEQAPPEGEAVSPAGAPTEPAGEPGTQPEVAPPAEQEEKVAQLLTQVEAAVGQWDFAAARDALQQVKATDLYASDQAVRGRTDRLEQQLNLTEQQLAERRAELGRVLEAVDAGIAAGDVVNASAMLADVEESDLYKWDEGIRTQVAALRQTIQAAEEKAAQESQQASVMLQEAETKIAAEEFADAADLLQKVEATAVYAQQKALRARVAELNKRLAAAKKKAAERLFAQAAQAYEAGDYVWASGLLDELDRWSVDLGRRKNARLAAMRQEVRDVLEQCRKLFEEGERLYKMGNYEDAAEALRKLQQFGAKCGEELQQAAVGYLEDIEKQAKAEAVARLEEKVRMLEEMKHRREEAMKSLLDRERMRGEALAALEQADAEWQAERFAEAKPLLEQAKALLEKPELGADEALQQARQKVEARLAEIGARIEAQKERERSAAELQGMFEAVEKLKGTDLLVAEKKLAEALDFARHAALDLSAAQQAVADDVRAAVEAAYGQERRERTERYWELVEQSKSSVEVGEWEHALELLKLAAEAPNLWLTGQRSAKLNQEIEDVSRRLEVRGLAMAEIRALAAEADAALQADKGDEALAKYGGALGLADTNRIPLGQLESLISGYEAAASRVLPRLVETQVAAFKENADKQVAQALLSQEVELARFHLDRGNDDLAKPLLVAVAGNDQMPAEAREWARQKLEGVDARIASLRERELLATKEAAEAAYALEKEFQDAAARGDMEAAQRLAAGIGEARAAWLAARARRALDRGAYEMAEAILEEDAELVAQHSDAPAFQGILAKVEPWRKARNLVSDATQALKERQAEGVSRALTELQKVKMALNPFSGVLLALQSGASALVQLDGQQGRLQKWQEEGLQTIRDLLARDRARRQAWNRYAQAVKLYAEGNWVDAERALGELGDYVGALLPFERKHVEQLLAVVEPKAKAIAKVERTTEVEDMLREAEADIAARQFARAADALDKVSGDEAYRSTEDVRRQVAELRQKVAAAEDEATQLYQKAREAYQAGDLETLKPLLDELNSKYQHTCVYAQQRE